MNPTIYDATQPWGWAPEFRGSLESERDIRQYCYGDTVLVRDRDVLGTVIAIDGRGPRAVYTVVSSSAYAPGTYRRRAEGLERA